MPERENFLTLADIYWTTGEEAVFETFTKDALKNPDLALSAISLMQKAGGGGEALGALDMQPEDFQAARPARALRSALLLDLGDVQGALNAGRLAGDGTQDDNYELVRALLVDGQAQEALKIIDVARARDPLNQFWLAYETTALRLLGDARYNKLIDYDRHVQSYQLPVPEGFETLDAFNKDFLTLLDQMNPFDIHPLNQSLRGGGQAPHDLSVSQHPLLKAYFKALHQPVTAYMAKLGIDTDHPSARRNTGQYKFSGSWSVRLGGGGHHVNHVHPRGWISSAYYVSVPKETSSGDSKAGWLKFGEPPILTKPVLAPETWVQPQAGMVVLFPSFLWHGTEPIHDGSVRVTAPFDVVPIEVD